jgi:hypothetical protein
MRLHHGIISMHVCSACLQEPCIDTTPLSDTARVPQTGLLLWVKVVLKHVVRHQTLVTCSTSAQNTQSQPGLGHQVTH